MRAAKTPSQYGFSNGCSPLARAAAIGSVCLAKTPTSTSNQKQGMFSAWVKTELGNCFIRAPFKKIYFLVFGTFFSFSFYMVFPYLGQSYFYFSLFLF